MAQCSRAARGPMVFEKNGTIGAEASDSANQKALSVASPPGHRRRCLPRDPRRISLPTRSRCSVGPRIDACDAAHNRRHPRSRLGARDTAAAQNDDTRRARQDANALRLHLRVGRGAALRRRGADAAAVRRAGPRRRAGRRSRSCAARAAAGPRRAGRRPPDRRRGRTRPLDAFRQSSFSVVVARSSASTGCPSGLKGQPEPAPGCSRSSARRPHLTPHRAPASSPRSESRRRAATDRWLPKVAG